MQHSLPALLTVSLAVFCAGCGDPPIDSQARLDKQVETEWPKTWNPVDGIQFLEKGGLYADSGDPEDQAIDRAHVLPLLKRLKQEFGLDWQAFVYKNDPKMAVAMAARLPDDEAVRTRIQDALQEEQATFPGDINQQWGHAWIELDFLNQEQAEFMNEGDLD